LDLARGPHWAAVVFVAMSAARKKKVVSVLSLSELSDVTSLPLDRPQIAALSSAWDPTASQKWHQAWSDILWLAQMFLASSAEPGPDTTTAWHHLLMAVGNFKRSAGLIVPASLSTPSPTFTPPGTFTIPGNSEAVVARDDFASWQTLTRVPGLGVPTATTLLSALWPGHHVIIDIRDSRASVGISADAGWDAQRLGDCDLPDRTTDGKYWEFYEWFLPVIVATAGTHSAPVEVERALYALDMWTRRVLPAERQWTWTRYREEAETIVASKAAKSGTD
jgi:hypothetical protein